MIPYKIQQEVNINIEKVFPLNTYKDYYVNFLETPSKSTKLKKGITRRALPKIDEMLEWRIVKAGDTIVAKGRDDEAILMANGNLEGKWRRNLDAKMAKRPFWLVQYSNLRICRSQRNREDTLPNT